ncbi:hypothetical protein X801_04741, partial [Opisthorchis viverrini]
MKMFKASEVHEESFNVRIASDSPPVPAEFQNDQAHHGLQEMTWENLRIHLFNIAGIKWRQRVRNMPIAERLLVHKSPAAASRRNLRPRYGRAGTASTGACLFRNVAVF